MPDVQLVSYKDHPLGGYRIWRKGAENGSETLFHVAIMDDKETLTDKPQWDLENWIANLPTDKELEATTFQPAQRIYGIFYRLSDGHHGAWNVCAYLQDYLPANSTAPHVEPIIA